MAHAPALLFGVENRGFIREGYFADLVVVNPNQKIKVEKSNCLYKCGWSPFENHLFSNTIEKTFVNGNLAYDNTVRINEVFGSRLTFNK